MELKQEAADLEDPGKLGADDTAHCMRKVNYLVVLQINR